jgi:hypothetical protein
MGGDYEIQNPERNNYTGYPGNAGGLFIKNT